MDRGAHFYKTDLQVHTPRDAGWDGEGAITDVERANYAREFVAGCRRQGLQAIAVTDHHDVAFFKYIRDAALLETDDQSKPLPLGERLVVFPGMELTLGIPCQALLIFDADLPVEFLALALTALGITPSADTAEKTAAVKKLDIMSFVDLYAALDKLEPLRGRFIAFPHVSDGGYKTLLRKDFEKHYIAMPCVGGYVDGQLPTEPKSAGMRSITNGKDKNWGNKALGLFQTSDNRSRAFAKLGVHATWVKWARPTAEALRQACLARRSRISQAEPALPAIRIDRIEVSNSKFMGPFQIELNPQYTALIGGRGTGKSSILEYLRWALCDQPLASTDDDLPDFQNRRASLIEKTLRAVDASVQVAVLVNGTDHVVRRHVDGRLLLKIGAEEFRAATEGEIRSLLPLQAYSQKQLSSVGIKGDELRRFVHLPIQVELDALRSKLSDIATRIRATHDALREHRRLAKENAVARTELQSIEQQLAGLRQSLRGVTEADRAVIGAQAGWSEEQRFVDRWRKEVSQATKELRDLRGRVQLLPTSLGDAKVHDRARLVAMEGLLRELFADADGYLAAAENALMGDSAPREKLKLAAAAWDAACEENRKTYAEAKGRASESEVALKQISDLERRQVELVESVSGRDRRILELQDPEKQSEDLQQEWRTTHAERTSLLDAQCRKLTDLSMKLLRATVQRGAGTAHIAAALKELVKGSKMRAEKFEQLLQAVMAEADPLSAWLDVVSELRALSEVDEPASAPLPPCPRLGSAQIAEGDRRKMAERLAIKGWAEFATLELEDVPRFEYRAREAEYIAFGDASAGQQATALMFVLLNQDGPPLVIDQPEDDLDNHVITDVVEQVWRAKSKRQLIFSSHNANLVVNGDAELVVCCGYRTAGDQSGGTVTAQGAIDIAEVCAEIATVMEGGRDAFTLRKEKYGF
ncbi:MAG: AAA family ATPase [Pseudomonadota bacterium]